MAVLAVLLAIPSQLYESGFCVREAYCVHVAARSLTDRAKACNSTHNLYHRKRKDVQNLTTMPVLTW